MYYKKNVTIICLFVLNLVLLYGIMIACMFKGM